MTATMQEYWLLASDVYLNLDVVNPPPTGSWQRQDQPVNFVATDAGFFARAYANASTGEIVIAYRGTDDAAGNPDPIRCGLPVSGPSIPSA